MRRICWLPRIPPCSTTTLELGSDSQLFFSGLELIVGPRGQAQLLYIECNGQLGPIELSDRPEGNPSEPG